MSDPMLGREKIKQGTAAALATTVLRDGQPCRATDTDKYVIGNGTADFDTLVGVFLDFVYGGVGNRNPEYALDFNGSMRLSAALPTLYIDPSSTSGFRTDVRDMASGLLYRLQQDGSTKMTVEFGCPDEMLYLDSAGRLDINGSTAIGSSGRIVLTTGTYNGYDVSDKGLLLLNSASGNITVNDLTGGVTGQLVEMVKIIWNNDVVITSSSGSNQEFRIENGTTTISGLYGRRAARYTGTYWVST